MKQLFKYILFGFIFFLFTQSDTLAFSFPSDTIRQKKVNGIRVKPYKVQSKETWTSISQKCKVSVAYLKTVNAGVENLKNGQIINVPIEEGEVRKDNVVSYTETVVPDPGTDKESKYREPVYHIIKKGETMFGVAKMYNQTIENIKLWNHLNSNDLKVDQKIVVNYVYNYKKELPDKKPEPSNEKDVPEEKKEEKNGARKDTKPAIKTYGENKTIPSDIYKSSESLTASTEKNAPIMTETKNKSNLITTGTLKVSNGHTIKQINETGVAAWIMDGEQNQNKYYALHRNAPVGTIVKVTNRMNGKYVFVKVVGLLPNTGDNDNLIIKVSQAASNKINVLDSKFQAELSYGVSEGFDEK